MDIFKSMVAELQSTLRVNQILVEFTQPFVEHLDEDLEQFAIGNQFMVLVQDFVSGAI